MRRWRLKPERNEQLLVPLDIRLPLQLVLAHLGICLAERLAGIRPSAHPSATFEDRHPLQAFLKVGSCSQQKREELFRAKSWVKTKQTKSVLRRARLQGFLFPTIHEDCREGIPSLER